MASSARRMKAMREHRRAQGLRDVRPTVPDARSSLVRRRVAAQVAALNPDAERDTLDRIESVSEFDDNEAR